MKDSEGYELYYKERPLKEFSIEKQLSLAVIELCDFFIKEE